MVEVVVDNKKWLNSYLLIAISLFAIYNPKYIQKYAGYANPSVLIADWGIYALVVALMLSYPEYSPHFVLSCYVTSFIYNAWMYRNGLLLIKRFFWLANFLNLVGILEFIYYFKTGNTFLE